MEEIASKGFSVEHISYDEIKNMNSLLKENVFSEGYSLKFDQNFMEALGFVPYELLPLHEITGTCFKGWTVL